MSKKKRSTKSKSSSEQSEVVYISEYAITSTPIEDKRYRRLPQEVKTEFARLHALVQMDARKAIGELPQWIKRYPDIPLLYNYLSVAYSQTGARHKAEQIIVENLRRNPDYLFARLNYAEICMARGDYQAAAETLDNKFDLKLLCPHRKLFHISEFVGFMNVVGRYFAHIGERESAEKVYEVLRQVAPSDRATRQLHSELYPGALRQIVRRLLRDIHSASA